MSTARCLLALACICSSALGGEPPSPGQAYQVTVQALSLELGVARTPEVYLVLDPFARQLEIKARGMVLDRVEIDQIVVLVEAPWLGGGEPRPLELPALWRVAEATAEGWRRVVAPETLRPYSEAEAELTPAPTPRWSSQTAAAVPPDDYLCRADSGWRLRVCSRPPGGLWRRLRESLGSGWRRLCGQPLPEPTPTLTLVMAGEDARRLCHLFRPPVAILILAPQPRA